MRIYVKKLFSYFLFHSYNLTLRYEELDFDYLSIFELDIL